MPKKDDDIIDASQIGSTTKEGDYDKPRSGLEIESTIWKMIDAYFEENPQALVNHHIESYNDFFQKGIYQIFRDKNPSLPYFPIDVFVKKEFCPDDKAIK